MSGSVAGVQSLENPTCTVWVLACIFHAQLLHFGEARSGASKGKDTEQSTLVQGSADDAFETSLEPLSLQAWYEVICTARGKTANERMENALFFFTVDHLGFQSSPQPGTANG